MQTDMTRVYTEGGIGGNSFVSICSIYAVSLMCQKRSKQSQNLTMLFSQSLALCPCVSSLVHFFLKLSFTLCLLSIFQSIYLSTHAKLGSLFSFLVNQSRVFLQPSVFHIWWYHPKHADIICVSLRLLGMRHCSIEMDPRAEEIHITLIQQNELL